MLGLSAVISKDIFVACVRAPSETLLDSSQPLGQVRGPGALAPHRRGVCFGRLFNGDGPAHGAACSPPSSFGPLSVLGTANSPTRGRRHARPVMALGAVGAEDILVPCVRPPIGDPLGLIPASWSGPWVRRLRPSPEGSPLWQDWRRRRSRARRAANHFRFSPWQVSIHFNLTDLYFLFPKPKNLAN